MGTYILTFDQGTTSSRAIIFDDKGSVVSVAQKEYKQHYPKPGWVEHDPEEIWQTQHEVASEAIEKAGLTGEDIQVIGITNQRETTLVWDRKTGKPIHNAIVWQDRRTSRFCDQLKDQGLDEQIKEKTGLVIDAYFSGTKVKWILDNVEGAREKAEAGELAFGTVDTWLVWKLTGGELHITDASNASRTMLFNINSGQWDSELLDMFDIPRQLLPEVRSSSEVYGKTSRELFDYEIPIGGIAGDQQAALFGQLCTQPGMVKNTYGTGCFMLMHTGEKPISSQNNLLTTVAWKLGDKLEYALEGSVFIGGAVVQWLRDELGLIENSEDIEELAASVEDNGDTFLVPAFSGLGAPHWDQYARGTIVGMTRGTNAGHIARAALESIAYQSADVLKAMVLDSDIDIRELRVDGGAAVNNLLMQFQADILDTPVLRPQVLETTALGAAYLAGLAAGVWGDVDAIADHWKLDRKFSPSMDSEEVDYYLQGWTKAYERAKDWATE